MKLKVFDYKKIVSGDTIDDDYIDLLGDTYKEPNDFESFTYIIVDSKYDKRPDLLCYDLYNDINMVDILLKNNNISNPYFLSTGMKIKVYTSDISLKYIKTPTPIEVKNGINSFEDPIKKQYTRPENIKSKQRIDYLKEKFKALNKSGEFLPPTFVKSNRPDILRGDDYVLYGTQKTTLNN